MGPGGWVDRGALVGARGSVWRARYICQLVAFLSC